MAYTIAVGAPALEEAPGCRSQVAHRHQRSRRARGLQGQGTSLRGSIHTFQEAGPLEGANPAHGAQTNALQGAHTNPNRKAQANPLQGAQATPHRGAQSRSPNRHRTEPCGSHPAPPKATPPKAAITNATTPSLAAHQHSASLPAPQKAAKPLPIPHSSTVNGWIQASCDANPLPPATVMELARVVQAWRSHPDGPEGAPEDVRRRGVRARNRLVVHNLRLIGHLWGRHRCGIPDPTEATADALQEAALALVRAVEKFDPTRGYTLGTYATFWIKQGFGYHERQHRRLIRLPHHKLDLLARLWRLSEQHLMATGQAPTTAWLAERCGTGGQAMAPAAVEQVLLVWRQTLPLELDRPCGPPEEGRGALTLMEQVMDPHAIHPAVHDPLVRQADFPDGPATYATCAADSHDPQRSLLPLLLEHLDPVSRRLIWHRHLREHPLTARQVCRVMGLTLEEQKRLEAEALQTLRAVAQSPGVGGLLGR